MNRRNLLTALPALVAVSATNASPPTNKVADQLREWAETGTPFFEDREYVVLRRADVARLAE